ncbi:MAG TPA: AEC family transporter [Candidatus Lustribacter sp.]|nr:AEC family transporter [Candidatus Lustribacter sp.]
MAILSALLTVVLPVLIVAGVGALLSRRFELDQTTITKLSLNGLTPALALHTLLTTAISPGTGTRLAAAYLVVSLAAVALAGLATPGMTTRTRRAVMACAAIGNNGNMGLPISLFALGRAGLDQSVVIFLCSVVLTFTLGPLLYGSTDGPLGALRAVVRLPVLWAMAVAVGIRLLALPVPLGVMRGIELLAQATLPMILLALGIALGRGGAIGFGRPVLTAVGLRVLVMPVAGLGVGWLFGLRGLPLEALVLSGAMPTAVNAYLLAREYDADAVTVADAVTLSTLASIASAAVVTALLPAIAAL